MALEHLLEVGEGIPAPEKVRRAANLQDVRAEHARSLADPAGFWGEQAKRFRWSQPWTRVLDWRVPDHQWFLGGKLNITENALDRHADGPRRNHRAFVLIDEDGAERVHPALNAPPSSIAWPQGEKNRRRHRQEVNRR